eukprot:7581970-Alexandrium_andersonii.AAC.1
MSSMQSECTRNIQEGDQKILILAYLAPASAGFCSEISGRPGKDALIRSMSPELRDLTPAALT